MKYVDVQNGSIEIWKCSTLIFLIMLVFYDIPGMQDFNYLATNAFEITLELGCEKYPRAELVEKEWYRNKEALLAYLWKAHIGVKGTVCDEANYLENAVISVVNITEDRAKPIRHDVTTAGLYYFLL